MESSLRPQVAWYPFTYMSRRSKTCQKKSSDPRNPTNRHLIKMLSFLKTKNISKIQTSKKRLSVIRLLSETQAAASRSRTNRSCSRTSVKSLRHKRTTNRVSVWDSRFAKRLLWQVEAPSTSKVKKAKELTSL